jgi:hypothetical protein
LRTKISKIKAPKAFISGIIHAEVEYKIGVFYSDNLLLVQG